MTVKRIATMDAWFTILIHRSDSITAVLIMLETTVAQLYIYLVSIRTYTSIHMRTHLRGTVIYILIYLA